MTRTLKSIPLYSTFVLVPVGLFAQPMPKTVQGNETNVGSSSDTHLVRLTKELHELKLEVVQLRIEAEQARLEVLEREAQRAEDDLQTLAAEENGLKQEVEDLQRQSLDFTLTPNERAEIATTASKAMVNGTSRLTEERMAIDRRRSILQGKLTQAYETRSQLLARSQSLTLGAASQDAR